MHHAMRYHCDHFTHVLRGVLTGNLNRTAFANETAEQHDLGRDLRFLVRAVILSHELAPGSKYKWDRFHFLDGRRGEVISRVYIGMSA